MSNRIYASRPDNWTSPRPYSDASLRRAAYGRIQPMHEPSWFDRLLGRG